MAARILRKRTPRKSPRSPVGDVGSGSVCRIVPASGVGVAFATTRGQRCVLWAFGVDVLTCPRCGGTKRLLAAIQDPDSIERVLRAMGLSNDMPELAPARAPPSGSELQSLQLGW
ncbi:MAG: hypothetical protein ACI8UD_000561 [Planctomycetota bacterium]|jgi:hypothetical protein